MLLPHKNISLKEKLLLIKNSTCKRKKQNKTTKQKDEKTIRQKYYK